MARRTLYPLFPAADEPIVRPLLDALKGKGFAVDPEHSPKKNDAVLFFLSKNLEETSPEVDRFLQLDAQNCDVIPVNLDGSTPPALIENALMARNSIFADRYTAEELVDRIAGALKKPVAIASKLRKWIIAAAAVVLAAVVGIVLWRVLGSRKAEETAVETTPAPTAAPTVPTASGISPEDLARIHQLFIIGDRMEVLYGNEEWVRKANFAKVDAEHYANRIRDDSGTHWLDNETAEEISLYRWEDLDFLRYMTNLQFLDVICVEGTLPDLSGLKKLDYVHIADCNLSDLNGLAGANIGHFQYENEAMDFSPLNSCQKLKGAYIELYGELPADLSAFGPPALEELRLTGSGSQGIRDASGLHACVKLKRVMLNDLGLQDLSCLANATAVTELYLNELHALTSLSGLENHTRLNRINIDSCFELIDLNALSSCAGLTEFEGQDFRTPDLSFLTGATKLTRLRLEWMNSIRSLHGLEDHTSLADIECNGLRNLTDISALESCTSLSRIHISESFALNDVSPVVRLPRLRTLELYGAGPNNVDYLADIVNKNYFCFGVSEVDDWSGLAAITYYDFLNITDRNGSALPYVKDAVVNRFEFWNRNGGNRGSNIPVDYSRFPTVRNELTLHGVSSLEGLPAYDVTNVKITESDFLTSLDGIQNLNRIKEGNYVDLMIEDCPRLSDWSALEGLSLSSLHLEKLFSIPTFKDLSVRFIRLESIIGLDDLSPLRNLDPSKRYDIELFDLDGVTDLSPLNGLKGNRLSVPAHLGQQAQLLEDSSHFGNVDIEYTNEWWRPYEPNVKLYSLEEIDTLPSALLAYVQDVNLLGDRLFNWDEYEWESDWSTHPATYTLINRATGEREVIPTGTMTDLSGLSALTGLKRLNITNQALESLEGIQYLSDLEELCAEDCRSLTDVSAAFTVQGLRKLQLTNAPYTSIEGVQNLPELEELKIRGTQVDSIEGVQTLSKLRFFDLQWTRVTDFSPLGALPDDCEIKFTVDGVKVQDFLALPDSVLAKVQSLCIAGDWLYNGDGQWWDEDWSSDGTRGWLVRDDGNRTPIGQGTLTDLSFLHRLPNLKRFRIHCNPIVSPDGIETLSHLEEVQIHTCPKITDVSVLFDLPMLERISVRGLPITSVAGIERLPRLSDLSIANTQITDLSPLSGIDTSYADTEHRGFNLSIDNLPKSLTADQFAVLSHFKAFWNINVFNTDCSLWMDALKNVKIYEIHAGGCNFTNETFRQFVEQHPELEYIKVSWTPQLTDVSPLLTLKNLRTACVSHNMPQAIASLGEEYPFRLEIEN